MDNTTRLHYLHAMGIESWIPRSPPAFSAAVISVAEEQLPPVTPSTAAMVIAPPVLPTDNWAQLQAQVQACQQCELCQTRHQTVFGSGNTQADWLFIGEAPGEQEDLQGQPFVGVAGQLLTEMVRAMALSREQIYIANILKCRPPANRDPKVAEMAACQSFLQRQIALLAPKFIVAVGRIAAQQLLNTHEPLAKLRGKMHHFQTIPLMVVYHPAYLLRDLRQKSKAWQDLQTMLKTYQALQGH